MANQTFELTREQQQILLQGLRFVRSSVELDVQDYSEAIAADRKARYAQIGELEEIVNSAPISEAASV
ncbi:MAG: hypothetical protein DWQ34_26610 [Planctomycetota bacterium]|nr:MAG: hypothetical protein DWQ29_24820 [Planctomycetota bacterium]REJ86853.1 MAG: hypothetical protein DWQ34_26610 [Planctomycetota bacterium]REK22792.1 MAG: hypothetical protein DWQ41_18515 [Planctomycetota bacterium]REK33788.1 MAG: hypothetical protein DWQ45_14480 [Planctomycetota bacterium]